MIRITSLLLLALAACGGEEAPAGDGGTSPAAGASPSSADEAASRAPQPVVGDWPELRAELDRLTDGRPYLLNFWATWCPPCIAEMPHLVEVVRTHEEQGLLFVTISYDYMVAGVNEEQAVDKVRNFQAGFDLPYPVLILDAPDHEAINEALSLPGGVPNTLAFDATGAEVGRIEGAGETEDFRELARLALGADAPASHAD